MPVLAQEPSIFPEDLLCRNAEGADPFVRWWVLHTRPRAEKALARRLLGWRLHFFLPLYEHQSRRSGRFLRSYLPLFPGYIFLYGDGPARQQALTTNLIARTLQVGDQEQLHADLARVHRLTTAGVPVMPEARLQPGTQVEIIAGPLAGLQGKVLRSGKRWMFFVEVELLQRGVSVEIDGSLIEPLASPLPAQSVTPSSR